MIALALAAAVVSSSARPILVTVDDLPIAADELHTDPAERLRLTKAMLAVFAKHHIKAIGFVAGKHVHDAKDEALLSLWTAAGQELGNHTANHLHLNSAGSEKWIADAEQERVALKVAPRFFRYPFLEEGDTPEKYEAVRAYLARSKQRNVSPTIDTQDWSYEKPFVEATRKKDRRALQTVTEDYRAAMRLEILAQEDRGDSLLGPKTPQILLLHAGAIGADQWDGLFTWLEENGHRFASADEVLADAAFAQDAQWIGPYGFGLWDRLIARKREAKAFADVATMLTTQAKAWTDGDLDAFCSVYASDATFVSPSGITHGRDAVLARYKAKYPTKAAMGALSLEILESRALSGVEITDLEDARPGRVQGVSVVAKWTLTYPDKPAATGSTQLVLRPRAGGGWEIVSDASM